MISGWTLSDDFLQKINDGFEQNEDEEIEGYLPEVYKKENQLCSHLRAKFLKMTLEQKLEDLRNPDTWRTLEINRNIVGKGHVNSDDYDEDIEDNYIVYALSLWCEEIVPKISKEITNID